jgi:large subunit ribosomal protein L17
MRHRVAGKKLNRTAEHRKALRRNLMTELFRYERIRTTRAKAQAVRGQAEKMITMAKRSLVAAEEDPSRGVFARRRAASQINDPEVVRKLFDDIAPRYVDRPGGYTRMLRLGVRKGDAAQLVVLELVEEA